MAWEQKLETNDDEIRLWDKLYPYAHSTGILCKYTPTLDIDILNPEAAEAVEALVRERFEEHGCVLVRIGQAPKRAILFRTDAPFKKLSVNLIAPDGSEGQKLELLADGQQVVAFGIHEDTGKPYAWHGGEPGDIARDDLPYVNAEQARALVDDAAALLCRARLSPRRRAAEEALADSVVLRFRNGLFLLEGGGPTLERLAREQKADETFLDVLAKLIKQNRPVSPSAHASNYGPKVIAGHPEGKAYSQRDYQSALERLLAADRIHIASFGPPSKPLRHLAPGPAS